MFAIYIIMTLLAQGDDRSSLTPPTGEILGAAVYDGLLRLHLFQPTA